jgi:excisionase family DNA binding protein
MEQLQKLLNRKQAAEVLGIKPQTLAAWVTTKRYNLPFIKIGRRVLYAMSDLQAFIQNNRFEGGLQ